MLELPAIDLPAPAEGMLWGDGFEIETVINCRVAAAGLKITEVPSMERERIFGETNLRTFADGTARAAHAGRRAPSRRPATAERVQVEEQARALTPPGGFPAVTPDAGATDLPRSAAERQRRQVTRRPASRRDGGGMRSLKRKEPPKR